MKQKFFIALLFTAMSLVTFAQEKEADTVIVPLANSSKVIFIIKDRNDIEKLKEYDFQLLFNDIISKIEKADSAAKDTTIVIEEYASKTDDKNNDHDEAGEDEDDGNDRDEGDNDNDDDDDDDNYHGRWHGKHGRKHFHKNRIGSTWQSTNIDLGINNFLTDEKQFPDGDANYAVRPWGSWYVGINSVQRTRVARKFFVEWGLGVSWYNFKFEKNNILISKDSLGVHFNEDARAVDYTKSKLTATYINASIVPLLDVGERHRKRKWDDHKSEFRLGIGPYVGYRIASRSKLVFEENGDEVKEKNRDNFYLNDLRYGVRFQLGFRSTDFFVNYDMNDLFAANKGPKLNAVSFGVIF